MNVKRQIILLVFILTIKLVTAQGNPNILLIIADDMGADVMPGYGIGTNLPNTPNLDKLRQNGLTFSNVWAAPVCSATRATIMTGKYGVNSGVNTVPGILSTDHQSIFKQLKQQSNDTYSTCLVGKWHLGRENDYDHPNEHGIDDFMGVMGAGVTDYYSWNKVENQTPDICNEYATTYFTDYAIDWIKKQNQSWLMWMGHVSPHAPFEYPPEGTFLKNKEGTPNMKKYLSMIENLDYEIGRLLDSIPDDVLENTLIIFVGDNGTPGNVLQTYTSGKGSLYQGGVHVPLVISGKGVSRINETEDAHINVCDLYATIAHLSNDDIDEKGGLFNSLSFKHLLTNTEGVKRSFNYMELGAKDGFPLDAYTIRDDQYKMIQYIGGVQELFDLENDPYEANNLLLSELSTLQVEILSKLENEVNTIRTAWSCNDGIQNGDETGIDCGGQCGSCELNVAIEQNPSKEIIVFPNPFGDKITIMNTEQSSAISVQIFNALGQQLDANYLVKDKMITINTTAFRKGLYLVAVKDSNSTIIKKIVKQ